MRIDILTEPAVEPVLLDEVKDHLRIDGSANDIGLGSILRAARQMLERYIQIQLISGDLALYLDSWPASLARAPWWQGVSTGSVAESGQKLPVLQLPVRPVQSIQSIQIFDAAGNPSVWASDNYTLKPGMEPVLACQKGSWPVARRALDGIRIELKAGYGDSWNDVPADLRQALLMLVTHLFENKGDTNEMAIKASGASAILSPYRKLKL